MPVSDARRTRPPWAGAIAAIDRCRDRRLAVSVGDILCPRRHPYRHPHRRLSGSGGLQSERPAPRDCQGRGDTVSVFVLAPGGRLTQVPGSPFATGPRTYPRSVAFSPDGRLLATANTDGNSVSVFSVEPAGRLTAVPGSPFAIGGRGADPVSVAFSPLGGLVATANLLGNTVSVLAVRPGGALTQVSGSPFAAVGGSYLESVAFSPNGRLLATADSNQATFRSTGAVSVFAIGSHGALTQVPGSPFPTTGFGTDSVAFSPSGGFVAAANYFGKLVPAPAVAYSGTVDMFSVGSGGALTGTPESRSQRATVRLRWPSARVGGSSPRPTPTATPRTSGTAVHPRPGRFRCSWSEAAAV